MNKSAKRILKNFSYSITANLISLLTSVAVTFIAPKLLSIEEYGYWQLFMFYSIYVGFLHFGWNDGIFLRYGGKDYNDLDKQKFHSQFYSFFLFQSVLSVMFLLLSIKFTNIGERVFVLKLIALTIVLTNTRYMLQYILQCTNRIKEYSQVIIVGRVSYFIFVLITLLSGKVLFEFLVFSDVVSRLFALLLAMYYCKDIVFRKVFNFRFTLFESLTNITVGVKLLLSNISSLMIVGVIRFGIERNWDVSTFGKVSLTISLSNLFMLFINALGTIIYPLLKRVNESKLKQLYCSIRELLMVILLGALVIFFPLKLYLSAWLPQYSESLVYMSLLVPMCVYEGKFSLLINVFYNTMRKEKLILKINLLALIVSILLSTITAYYLKNLNLTVLTIVVVLAFRTLLAELVLSKSLNVFAKKEIVFETILISIFMMTSWFLDFWVSLMIYAVSYLIYIFVKKKDIQGSIKYFRSLAYEKGGV